MSLDLGGEMGIARELEAASSVGLQAVRPPDPRTELTLSPLNDQPCVTVVIVKIELDGIRDIGSGAVFRDPGAGADQAERFAQVCAASACGLFRRTTVTSPGQSVASWMGNTNWPQGRRE